MQRGEYFPFDVLGLWQALHAKRAAMGLSEREMMDDLNRVNHNSMPIALATVNGMKKRMDTSCQHSLHMLRWLDKTPESFLQGAGIDERLPFSADAPLYWSMKAVGEAVAAEKVKRNLSWKQVAQELEASQNQVSAIHKLRYGMSVHLAMKITQWLNRPSSDFIVVFK